MGLREEVAREMCKLRNVSPDSLYQHNFEGDYPEDERREFSDPFTGEPRVQLFHRAWRHDEKRAATAIAIVLRAAAKACDATIATIGAMPRSSIESALRQAEATILALGDNA